MTTLSTLWLCNVLTWLSYIFQCFCFQLDAEWERIEADREPPIWSSDPCLMILNTLWNQSVWITRIQLCWRDVTFVIRLQKFVTCILLAVSTACLAYTRWWSMGKHATGERTTWQGYEGSLQPRACWELNVANIHWVRSFPRKAFG